MAWKITDLTRYVTSSSDYPDGDIKDNPNGTLVNKRFMTDLIQTIHRAMRLAGITPNSQPDNVTNGYQVAEAFGIEAWKNLGTTLTVAVDSGTITVQTSDIVYNRCQLVGRTFKWQIFLKDFTITGSPNIITIALPAFITAASPTGLELEFAAPIHYQTNSFNANQNKILATQFINSGPLGNHLIAIVNGDNTAFASGTDDRVISINIEAELVPQ